MIRRIGTKRSLWFGTLAVIVLVGGLTVPGLAAPSGVKNFSFTVGPPSVAPPPIGWITRFPLTGASDGLCNWRLVRNHVPPAPGLLPAMTMVRRPFTLALRIR